MNLRVTALLIAPLVLISGAMIQVPQPQVSAGPGRPANQTQNAQVQSQLRSSVANNTSTTTSPVSYYNWSGYAASAATPFNAVQSTYVQPSVTCTVPGAWTLFWVGFDGFNNGMVEQAGTAAQCDTSSNPKPIYYAWWEMWPTNPNVMIMPLAIKPGDTINATVTYSAATANYSMEVNNKTTLQHYIQVAACASNMTCPRQTAEWIVERAVLNDGSYTPLANWGTMKLKGGKASNTTTSHGKPVYHPIAAFTNTPINMINQQYTVNMASVSPLNSQGNLFSDTWLAAQ